MPSGITKGFLSYTRSDNEAFRGVVDQLRQDLCAMYEAMTGKELELFLDRDSIGWGEDWRQKIHDSVDAASLFIPVVTMRYFTSSMCMEELLTFHAAAERLGVTELLLPIVLFGSDQIRDDDPRSEVALISRLNHKRAQGPWTAGYDSPEWREFITSCAVDLDRAIQQAESALAQQERAVAARSSGSEPADQGNEVGSSPDEPAGDEVNVDVEEMSLRMEELKPLTERAMAQLEKLGQLMSGFDPEGQSPQAAKVRMIRLANDLREPSQAIEKTGQEMEALMFGLDSQVRGLVAELGNIDLPVAREQLAGILQAFETRDDMSGVETEVESAISMLRLISLMNVSIKKSLAPASRGFRSIKNAVGVFRGWQQLREGLECA